MFETFAKRADRIDVHILSNSCVSLLCASTEEQAFAVLIREGDLREALSCSCPSQSVVPARRPTVTSIKQPDLCWGKGQGDCERLDILCRHGTFRMGSGISRRETAID